MAGKSGELEVKRIELREFCLRDGLTEASFQQSKGIPEKINVFAPRYVIGKWPNPKLSQV